MNAEDGETWIVMCGSRKFETTSARDIELLQQGHRPETSVGFSPACIERTRGAVQFEIGGPTEAAESPVELPARLRRELSEQADDLLINPKSAPTATSEAAADYMQSSGKAAGRRKWVLDQITRAGDHGRTNFELVDLYGGPQYQTGIQPRTTELCELGQIKDSGIARRRAGSRIGSTVWIRTTPEEEAAIQEAARRRERALTREPEAFAVAAAKDIVRDAMLGGLFLSEENFARRIQHAIEEALAGRKGRR